MKIPVIYYGIFSKRFNGEEVLGSNVKSRTEKQAWREYYKRNTKWPRGRWQHKCKYLDSDIYKKRQAKINEWNKQIERGERVLDIEDCISLYNQGADCIWRNGNPTITLAKLTKERKRLMETYRV